MSKSRQDIEKEFYEEKSVKTLDTLSESSLIFENEAVLKFSGTKYALNQLGDLNGKIILDYGCGFGINSVVMARLGATVYSFDISEKNIETTRKCAQLNKVGCKIYPQCMAAEHLEYADNMFDAVFGTAVLHHVDLKPASKELYRVMKPGGAKASFVEPLGENPFLEFVRNHLPYPNKDRTLTEKPMTYKDIRIFGTPFASTEIKEMEFLEMTRRIIRNEKIRQMLRLVDSVLLDLIPFFRRYCRVVVVTFTR